MINERIKQLRSEKGLRQEDVAEMLGIAHQTYFKWENGKTEPKASQMIKLAKILGVSMNDLCEESETKLSEKTKLKIIETEKLNDDEKNCLNMFIEALLLRHQSIALQKRFS